ncbi:GspE/PulE family protein [Pseudomonas alabamensis]|uniref:GspE/PulE family protein n=1 Tax=Pseudomonas alabamensis TaxID=3064349 RepID=UPI003F64BFC5
MYTPDDGSLDLHRLLDRLVDTARLTPAQAAQARECPVVTDHPLEHLATFAFEDALHPGRTWDLERLGQWLADQVGQPYLRLDPLQLDLAHITGLISPGFAQRHGILPVAADETGVTIASAQPYRRDWEADLAQGLGRPVRRVLACPRQLRQLGQTLFRLAASVQGAHQRPTTDLVELEHLLALGQGPSDGSAQDTHVVHIVDWVLQYAIEQRASDIHLEPRQDQAHLRYRIDGLLHPVYTFPGGIALALTSRLKHLARMNVAEKRRPQDGRLRTRLPNGGDVELRLSTLPTPFGEKLVLRLFDALQLQQGLFGLGLEGEMLARWQRLLRRPHGLLLVTGPTGSGKTSTLYASLAWLAGPTVNLCTIEDPIERLDPAFNQLQVQPHLDLDFAAGVRALLRQDPDILMIGEIRDASTAQVAVQAALTGHLVLSTLHTNDACSAIARLRDLGVADYLIKATLLGVMAQRLVRAPCPACHGTGTHAQGTCPTCRGTACQGRTGLFELLVMTDGTRQALTPHGDLTALRQQAEREGLWSLRRSGQDKVARGLTCAEEVRRVCDEA